MIKRSMTGKLLALSEKFPVIIISGPRQSGKTTLVKAVFPSMAYVSLEEPDTRQFALTDPRSFLSNYPSGAILDEIQQVPDLFSYIQVLVDANQDVRFILTGSANFLLMEKVSQTLAGRTAILHLLPLSISEIGSSGSSFENQIFKGQYPRLYDRGIPAVDFYPAYIQTYVEKDLRLIKNITNLNMFIRFIQLCAGRVGQLINHTGLANDAGISPNTAREWLSVLESSYILYRLQPYHQNFNKRLVKSAKLYFYDTGLACSLLGIRREEQVDLHYLKGPLFENLVINEFIKRRYNRGENYHPFFWQDHHGKEIDCLLENGARIVPVEVKSGRTFSPSYFDNLKYWYQLPGREHDKGYVVYGGDESFQTSSGGLVSWRDLEKIQEQLDY